MLLAGLLVLSGCSTREPSNPLDPDNATTGGRPQWLTAFADDGAVDLTWSVPRFEDVTEVRVVDLEDGSVIWTGGTGAGTARQEGVPNGVPRRYRLDLRLRAGAVPELPAVEAEPGEAVAWVLDSGSGRSSRMTPDARDLRFDLPVTDARILRVDPDSGSVLLADTFAGTVTLFDRDGGLRWVNAGFFAPVGLARDPEGWWVADAAAGTVTLLGPDGGLVFTDTTFVAPVEVISVGAGLAWVAEDRGAVVRLDRRAGVTARYEDLVTAAAIASAPGGGVWIAEPFRETLIRLSAEGTVRAEYGGYRGVVSLTADPRPGGGVWVSDRNRASVARVDSAGMRTPLPAVFDAPSRVAISPDGGELWVADPGARAVFRLDRAGALLGRSRSLGAPITVAVAFHPARVRP